MITYVTGDIFASTAQCLVNPVNCVGVMGGGLAYDFKLRFPDVYQTYREMCKDGFLTVGRVGFVAPKGQVNRLICLFPTKDHFKNPSTIDFVERGLQSFIKFFPVMNVSSVAFPKLGCGLGGLDFEYQIQPIMERYLSDLPINVEIYV